MITNFVPRILGQGSRPEEIAFLIVANLVFEGNILYIITYLLIRGYPNMTSDIFWPFFDQTTYLVKRFLAFYIRYFEAFLDSLPNLTSEIMWMFPDRFVPILYL